MICLFDYVRLNPVRIKADAANYTRSAALPRQLSGINYTRAKRLAKNLFTAQENNQT